MELTSSSSSEHGLSLVVLQVGQYLQALQMDPSPPRLQERLHWERQEAAVRRRRDQLQVHFQELLQQLGEGRPLETRPGAETPPWLDLPPLPKVPTVSLRAASSHSIENIEVTMWGS